MLQRQLTTMTDHESCNLSSQRLQHRSLPTKDTETHSHIHTFLKQAANMSSYIKEFFVMYLPPSILAQANHQTSPVVLVWTGFMCFD
jgi:hypothetical protein